MTIFWFLIGGLMQITEQPMPPILFWDAKLQTAKVDHFFLFGDHSFVDSNNYTYLTTDYYLYQWFIIYHLHCWSYMDEECLIQTINSASLENFVRIKMGCQSQGLLLF